MEAPRFTDGELEFRIGAEGVAIYATRGGLKALSEICIRLPARSLGRDGTVHVHLEDRALLTSNSVNAAIAAFERVD
ncbi:MAG TPA: hypothetical protein VGN12_00480 [Pirellulales bacterium]